MALRSWHDFEERFRRLAPALQYARIDDQTGAAGEYWRIAGGPVDQEARQEFETLCTLAGQQLTEVAASENDFRELLDHKDPKVRWWRVLKSRSASYERDSSGYQTDEEGINLGWIHGGSIHHICEGSANLYLELQASRPIKRPWLDTLYQDYGKQLIIGVTLLVIGAILGAWFK